MKRVAALALVLASAFDAQAYTPASGFWLNPNESGTGIAIEIEDKTLFMAAYVFDAHGPSTWFTSSGNLTTRVFLADFHAWFAARGYRVGKLYPEGVAFKDYDLDDEDFTGPNYIACRDELTEVIDGTGLSPRTMR